MVEHEVDRRQGAYGVDRGRQLTWLQEQVEGKSTATQGAEPAQHIRSPQPVAERLLPDEAPTPA